MWSDRQKGHISSNWFPATKSKLEKGSPLKSGNTWLSLALHTRQSSLVTFREKQLKERKGSFNTPEQRCNNSARADSPVVSGRGTSAENVGRPQTLRFDPFPIHAQKKFVVRDAARTEVTAEPFSFVDVEQSERGTNSCSFEVLKRPRRTKIGAYFDMRLTAALLMDGGYLTSFSYS